MSWYRPRLLPVPVNELYASLRSIASRWPNDALSSVAFKDTIEGIADKRFGPSSSRPVPSDAETASGKELAESLERMLANQYATEYKLSEDTLDPLGSPGHYLKVKRMHDRLEEYGRTQGEYRSRNWIPSFLRRRAKRK